MKMKKTRKRIALLIMLCMLTMLLPAGTGYAAYETIDIIQDGIKYNLRAGINTTSAPPNQAYITGYTSEFADGEVTIPGTITHENVTYTVRTINTKAFQDCSKLESISIPKGVSNIGQQAFLNCSNLREITFDDDGILSSIDKEAFQGTALQSIILPKMLTPDIDSNGSLFLSAFSGCTSLTAINVSENNAKLSSKDGVLFDKAGTTLIRYPEGKSGTYSLLDTVKTISEEAFSNCKQLQGITFGENGQLATIGSGAFLGCTSLQTITLPASLTNLAPAQGVFEFSDVFSGCTGLTDIHVADSNANYSSTDGVLFNKDQTNLVCYPEGKTASSYTIPSTVTKIRDKAFADCKYFTTVHFGAGVTVIGNRAFENCTGLTSIHIPAQVTEIGHNAFSGCTALSALTFAENCALQTIKTQAFQGCVSLTNITIPKQVSTLFEDAFSGCTGLTKVTFADDSPLKYITEGAFANCTALTEIKLPKSITNIGRQAFENCSSLTNIIIPQNVYKIDIDAFSGCTGLTSITIPKGVVQIEGGAFSGCSNLNMVTFEENSQLSDIGHGSFKNCTALTSITIPKSVARIEGEAFSGCSNLRLITFETDSNLSSDLYDIGYNAFQGCSKDLYIIYKGNTSINWSNAGIDPSRVRAEIKNTASSGWSPSASSPTLHITGQEGGSAIYDANKHTLTITPNADWLVEAVSVDGTPVVVTDGVMVLEHIYSWSKVSVSFAKKPEAPVKDNSKLVSGVNQTKLYASSKRLKQNKIRLTWRKANGYKVDYYLVYRAAKKNGKYQLVYTTKRADQKSYTGLRTTKSGKRYYYKIRGVRLIDDKKYYIKDSNILSRK